MSEITISRTDAELRAEAALTGALLVEPAEALKKAGRLSPDCFTLPETKAIYTAALDLVNTGTPADVAIIMSRCAEDKKHSVIISEDTARGFMDKFTGTLETVPGYAEILRKAAENDAYRRVMYDGLNLFGQPGTPSKQVASFIAQQLDGLSTLKMDGSGSVSDFDNFVEAIKTDKYKPFDTGMPAINDLLGGGFYRQALILLTGMPAIGKTMFTQQLFEGIARNGTPVLYLNLEMSLDQLLARSISRIASGNGFAINSLDIMRFNRMDADKQSAVNAAIAEYRETIAPNMEYITSGIGTDIESVMAELNNAAAKSRMYNRPAPVVVIDYLHLITSEKKTDEQEIIKKTVAELKNYAIRNNTIVFAIAANSREANNKDVVGLGAARGSSSIEYTADISLALNYKDLFETNDIHATDTKAMSELKTAKTVNVVLQVLKNRMPGTHRDTIEMTFIRDMCKFVPIDSKHEEYHIPRKAGRKA